MRQGTCSVKVPERFLLSDLRPLSRYLESLSLFTEHMVVSHVCLKKAWALTVPTS